MRDYKTGNNYRLALRLFLSGSIGVRGRAYARMIVLAKALGIEPIDERDACVDDRGMLRTRLGAPGSVWE